MDHDVFISFSSKDRAIADRILLNLEQVGIRCWISVRDIKPGEDYQDSIISAMESSKIVLLVFSSNANESSEVKKELANASAQGLPIIPLRTENVLAKGGMKYQLISRQHLDLFPNWDEGIRRVAKAIQHLLHEQAARRSAPSATAVAAPMAHRSTGIPEASSRSSSTTIGATKLSDRDLEQVCRDLAVALGPIASVLVHKAAGRVASKAELYRLLSKQIPSAGERSAFLRKAPLD
ncbi:MAG: toll/interleukin-1 receptor domain-containing protein [Gammaproteobacteria bacterium]